MSLRDKILSAQDAEMKKVHVPEWGCDVWIRAMSGADRDKWEQSLTNNKGETDITNARAKLVVFTVVDEKGDRIFSDEDILLVGQKSAKVLTRLSNVATKLNGLTSDDVEEARKN